MAEIRKKEARNGENLNYELKILIYKRAVFSNVRCAVLLGYYLHNILVIEFIG